MTARDINALTDEVGKIIVAEMQSPDKSKFTPDDDEPQE